MAFPPGCVDCAPKATAKPCPSPHPGRRLFSAWQSVWLRLRTVQARLMKCPLYPRPSSLPKRVLLELSPRQVVAVATHPSLLFLHLHTLVRPPLPIFLAMSTTEPSRRKARLKDPPSAPEPTSSDDFVHTEIPKHGVVGAVPVGKTGRRLVAKNTDRRVMEPFCTSKLAGWVKQFSPTQQSLVNSIGFGFLLSLPAFDSIDHSFALRLYRDMVVPDGILVAPDGQRAALTAKAVSDVLGLPCGPNLIRMGGTPSEAVVAAMDKLICDGRRKKHSFAEHAGHKLESLAGPNMKKNQDGEFLAAVLVYTVANFLAPRPDPSHVDADILEIAMKPQKVQQSNWPAYLLSVMLSEAKRIKEELLSKEPEEVPLGGCCLFLQVFFMEKFYPIDPRLKRDSIYAIDVYSQKILSVLIKCYNEEMSSKNDGSAKEISDQEILARFSLSARQRRARHLDTSALASDIVKCLLQHKDFISFFDACFEALLGVLRPDENLTTFSRIREAKCQAPRVNVQCQATGLESANTMNITSGTLQSSGPVPTFRADCSETLLPLFPASEDDGPLGQAHGKPLPSVSTVPEGRNQLDSPVNVDTTLKLSLQVQPQVGKLVGSPEPKATMQAPTMTTPNKVFDTYQNLHLYTTASATTNKPTAATVPQNLILRQPYQKDTSYPVPVAMQSPTNSVLRTGNSTHITPSPSATMVNVKNAVLATRVVLSQLQKPPVEKTFKKRAQKQLGLVTEDAEEPAVKTKKLSTINDTKPLSPFTGHMLEYHVDHATREKRIDWLLSETGTTIRGRLWFRSREPEDLVYLEGFSCVSQLLFTAPQPMSMAMMAAIMSLYKDKDDKLYARFPQRRWRKWITPAFPVFCVNYTKPQLENEFIGIFSHGYLNYDPSNCVLIFCPISVREVWMFIAFNLEQQSATVIDPIGNPDVTDMPDGEVTKVVLSVLDGLLFCLNKVSPRPWKPIQRWPIVYYRHSGSFRSDRVNSGRVSALVAFRFDGIQVDKNVNWDFVKDGSKQLLVDLLDTPCNKVSFANLVQEANRLL
ncbi:hypothetical protein ACP70R_046033 [Stipagrostis hirtigluma subsp. patula]